MTMPTLGVLGGMGPAATADFLHKLAERTPAERDQDHLRTVVYSDPTTPDRSDAILGTGPSPLPAMLTGIEFLERSGVDLIAIPCNTAHYWFEDLAAATSVPVVHMVEALGQQVRREAPEVQKLGLLSTDGTARSRIYHETLSRAGIAVLDLSNTIDNLTMAGIRSVKAGAMIEARDQLNRAMDSLIGQGAEGVIYGCTDASAALSIPPDDVDVQAWDAASALALACVERLMIPAEGMRGIA